METPLVDEYATASAKYGSAEVAGVAVLVAAGVISLVAVAPVLAVVRWYGPKLNNTRILPLFVSLLVSNALQAVGTIINSKWVNERTVVAGPICTAQGGIKQAGNVGMAVWSFALSLHIFMLLFVRQTMLPRIYLWMLVFVGWLLVFLVIVIGPTVLQPLGHGAYFGPSGFWCWITHDYPLEQFYLEYFLEYISAGLSFVLYAAVLLRVRGNLVKASGRWRLRFVPRGERWRLAIRRDATDSCMMQVAARMVWYPIAYTILLLPVTIARFVSFSGRDVPFRVTILADFVFNLQGVVNVALLLATRRFVPDMDALPLFEPRKHVSMSSPEAFGITPFVLPSRDVDPEKGNTSASGADAEARTMEVSETSTDSKEASFSEPPDSLDTSLRRAESRVSTISTSSVDSQTPLVLYIR